MFGYFLIFVDPILNVNLKSQPELSESKESTTVKVDFEGLKGITLYPALSHNSGSCWGN